MRRGPTLSQFDHSWRRVALECLVTIPLVAVMMVYLVWYYIKLLTHLTTEVYIRVDRV